MTLSTLLLPRRERIVLARVALECDGVMTRQQLQRNYGLQVSDLPGRWTTSTIVRPQAKADALEVATQILVASKRMTQLSDARLLHLVNLAELRQRANIAPDAQRWIVSPKSYLTAEEPDAVFINAVGEECAAESDVGYYRYETVADKLQSFQDRGYADLLYGVPSATRLQRMQQRFGDLSGFQALLTRWWTDT